MNNETTMDFGEFYNLVVGRTFKTKDTSNSPETYTLYLLVADAQQNPEDGDSIALHRVVVLDGGLPSRIFPHGSEIWYDEETTDAKVFFETWESCEPKEFFLYYYKVQSEISRVIDKHLPLLSVSHCGLDAGSD